MRQKFLHWRRPLMSTLFNELGKTTAHIDKGYKFNFLFDIGDLCDDRECASLTSLGNMIGCTECNSRNRVLLQCIHQMHISFLSRITRNNGVKIAPHAPCTAAPFHLSWRWKLRICNTVDTSTVVVSSHQEAIDVVKRGGKRENTSSTTAQLVARLRPRTFDTSQKMAAEETCCSWLLHETPMDVAFGAEDRMVAAGLVDGSVWVRHLQSKER